MADLSQLQEALVNADKAGDTQAATALAGEIKRMNSGVTMKQVVQSSSPMRVLQGMRDPIDAGAQLATHILPQSVVNAGNKLNNWLADKTGLVGRLPEGGVDQSIQENEREYQGARQATTPQNVSGLVTGKQPDPGFDWARLGGNVASPANLAIASKIPQAATTLGKIGAGVATGAGFGALSPVTQGDFWGEKAKQTAVGAATGGILPGIAEGAGRVISPNVREQITKLLREGVTPTPGQILGGRFQVAEDKLTSLPVIGDAIASARNKSLDEFNVAGYSRALDPIGQKASGAVGREGVAGVRSKLSAAYDDLLPRLSFKADQQFASDVSNLRSLASGLPDQQANQFEKIFQTQVAQKMTPQGLMNGERLKEVESELGRIAKGYKGDPGFDNRQLGDAISELQNTIRQTLIRNNPQHADELKAINTGYANYTRLRDAASRQGSLEGKFTPGQLSAAVRAGDKTVGKRAFSEGTALMQDLSDAGKNALAPKYPDSGSIGRLGFAALANPWAWPGAATGLTLGAAGSAAYLPGGRQLAAALLARRPDGAKELADAIRKAGPYLNPGAIPLLNQGTDAAQ